MSYIDSGFNVFCMVGYLILLFTFLAAKKKTYGSYYIITFNICFLAYSALQTFRKHIVKSQTATDIYIVMVNFLFYFCLFWSCAFAIYTCNLLKNLRAQFHHSRFMKRSVLICTLLGLIIPCMILFHVTGFCAIWNEKTQNIEFKRSLSGFVDVFIFLFLNDIVCMLLPVFACSYFNYQAYRLLKIQKFLDQENFNPFRAYWSFVLPMICLMPTFFQDIYEALINQAVIDALAVQISLLDRCWGLLTLIGFWFVKPVKRYQSFQEESDDDEALETTQANTSSQDIYKRTMTSRLIGSGSFLG